MRDETGDEAGNAIGTEGTLQLILAEAAASSSNLQVIGIVVASVMSALTTLGIAVLTYRTALAQEQTKRQQITADKKLDAINGKADVIHELTNSRLTMAIRAIIALKRKAGEALTDEELGIEKGDAAHAKSADAAIESASENVKK